MTPEQQTPASVVERLRRKATASFEANKGFGRKGKEWAIETEVEWQAAALIERLSAEREGLREELEEFIRAGDKARTNPAPRDDEFGRGIDAARIEAANEARLVLAALTQGESRQTGGWQDIATGAKAVIRDGKIVISIDVDALPVIVSGSCASNGLRGLWSVTDADVFAKEVCHSLNDEKEDGTTRVHLMFDSAFNHAIEQGGEGIETVTEAEFEAECSRFHALPPAPTDTGRE